MNFPPLKDKFKNESKLEFLLREKQNTLGLLDYKKKREIGIYFRKKKIIFFVKKNRFPPYKVKVKKNKNPVLLTLGYFLRP